MSKKHPGKPSAPKLASRRLLQQFGVHPEDRDAVRLNMKDIEDYHITPEQAARIANTAGVKLLVLYHLLPAPDGLLPRRLFVQGINEARQGDWTIADDGSLYTMPIGAKDVRIGQIER